MNGVIPEIVRSLVNAFDTPLILAILLVSMIVVTRAASSAWYLLQQRGRRPLVIRVDADKDQANGAIGQRALDDRLLAYLAADGHGNYVIAPGAGGPAAPGVATEALEASYGWQAALLRLAVARQPSYLIDVSWSQICGSGNGAGHQAVARISRMPGGRIVASDSFSKQSEEELIQTVGCFCITFLRSQPRTLRHTPRWERWGQGIRGYRAYRSGLEHQQRAELTVPPGDRQPPGHRELAEYQQALDCFHEAARIEPANLLVQLHRAALLELTGEYAEAAAIYEKCRTLWPEHIETAYRLGSARKNLPYRISYGELRHHYEQIEEQLALRNLATSWLRTLRPGRWNPGERRYWGSWLQLRLPGRITKRATYLHAVAIAKLVAELSCLLSRPGPGPRLDVQIRPADVLMEGLAAQLLRRKPVPCWVQLLHPDHPLNGIPARRRSRAEPADDPAGHDHSWHDEELNDVSRIPPYTGRRQHRGDIGWLALFNAACFFSVAIDLPPDRLPAGFAAADWRVDCARAAIREIGMLVRNPRHALEPDWLGTDPDLTALRDSPTGKAWTSFVGLPTTSPVRAASVRAEPAAGHIGPGLADSA